MALSWSGNCGHTDVVKKKSSTFSATSHCHRPSIFERTSTWSLTLCQRSPTGRAEANIHKSIMSPDQCKQVMKKGILRQVVQDQVRNRRMSLTDHLQPISPTGEEGSRSSSDGTPETQTTQVERNGGQVPRCFGQKRHPTTCSNNASHPLHDELRTGCNTLRMLLGRDAAQKGSNNHAHCRSVT